jgi:hypothetical protein
MQTLLGFCIQPALMTPAWHVLFIQLTEPESIRIILSGCFKRGVIWYDLLRNLLPEG